MQMRFSTALLLVLATLLAASNAIAAVPYAPTAEDAVPDAILGKGAPPSGTAVTQGLPSAVVAGSMAASGQLSRS